MTQISLLITWILSVSCYTAQTYNYYFGNLHAHTAFSDGNKDSVTSGVNKPDGSYAYAKLSNDFDFLGISEHNHFSSTRNPGFKLPRYQEGLTMANAENQDGTFLSLFGMEYGVASGNHGHVIIYGFNQLIGWEVGVGGSTGPNYDIYNDKFDYTSLFKKVRNNPNSFCYLAHPWWTDFSIDGTDETALAFSAYNQMYDSAIVGIPLRSGNAFSTFVNYSDYAPENYFNYYKKLLNVGYHIGIGYDHDNHNTNFGRGTGGRLVVLMPSLTRANLYAAMQQMHFYGSDDSNAKIDFNLDGNIMGSVLNGNYYPTISVTHNDPDGEQADTIRIWKGFKNSSSWAYTVQTVIGNNTAIYKDEQIYPGTEYYYFADIRQKDGQWIVTSPIWYTPGKQLSVKESEEEIQCNFFPNPASDQLNISFAMCEEYNILITDILGRAVYSSIFFEQNFTLDLKDIDPGMYEVFIRSKNSSVTKKIVIR